MKIKLRYIDTMSKNYTNEVLWKLITQWYDIDEDSEPDYIIDGGMGSEFTKFPNAVRIQIIGENIAPDFNAFDYAIGFDHMQFGDRYIRVPLYVFYDAYQNMLSITKSLNKEELCKRKFCSFVVSNSRYADPKRDEFFKKLCEYKKVDSAGRHLNNMGGSFLEDKLAFVAQYKFNIAFENCSSDGYTTEKIMEPMSVNSLPIYWGNPNVEIDFNKDSFINLSSFKTVEDCIEYIKLLDNDDDLYYQTLQQPWFRVNNAVDYNSELKSFFDNIFYNRTKEKRINMYGRQSVLYNNLDKFYIQHDPKNTLKYKISEIIKKFKS